MFYFVFTPNAVDITNATKQWNILEANDTALAVVDENNSASGLTVSVPGITPFSNAISLSAFPWTGDGSWFDENTNDPVWVNSTTFFEIATVSGLDSSKTYLVDVFGYHQDGDLRPVELNVNGGTALAYNMQSGTNVDDANFTVSGVTSVTINVRKSSANAGYISAFRIREFVPAPSLTVTPADLPLTPGGTISGTYADYATIPTTLTVSDGTNTITIASPTITDNGDGTGSFSGTMPALPTTGTANLVLFGNVTVELT